MGNILDKFKHLWSGKKADPPENVILIVIDALRWDGLSCYGNRRPTSPNIDSLAREGFMFTQAISACGNTPGAVGAIVSAKYPLFETEVFNADQTRITDFGFSRFSLEGEERGLFPRSLPMMSDILAKEGFFTAGISSNPFLTERWRFAGGFHEYQEFSDVGETYANAETVNEEVAKALLGRTGKTFLYVHYMDVHHPYNLPTPCNGIFKDGRDSGKTDGQVDYDWFFEKDVEKLESIHDHARVLYDEGIRYVDRQIGMLIETLRKERLLDKCLIVITSDHGDEFLEHGGTLHYPPKVYEELIRVPLIFSAPCLPAGTAPDLVRSVDILPTVLDILGIECGLKFDGASLSPLMAGRQGEADVARFAYSNSHPYRSIRTDRWKVIYDIIDGAVEVYDLQVDPSENENLAETHSKKSAELLSNLKDFCESLASDHATGTSDVGLRGDDNITEEMAKKLKGLGYM